MAKKKGENKEMIIKSETLQALRTMLRGEFADRLAELESKPEYKELATIITSNTAGNTYGWLSKFPQIREWIGDRVINSIKESSYALLNKKYEATLGVDRTDLEDDNLGIYRPLARAQADEVISFFNRKIFALLTAGFSSLCFDGQNFFDTEHPVYPNTDGTGTAVDVSNIQGNPLATGKPWFLLALTGVLKPFILQQRTSPELDEITDTKNDSVFMKDRFLYGIRYRGNFGYGFWQQAVGCKETLDAANYEAARLKMRSFKRDGGDPLGIVPTHLVVGPTQEAAARKLLETQFIGGGNSNPNYHTAQLIVAPWLE